MEIMIMRSNHVIEYYGLSMKKYLLIIFFERGNTSQ